MGERKKEKEMMCPVGLVLLFAFLTPFFFSFFLVCSILIPRLFYFSPPGSLTFFGLFSRFLLVVAVFI